MTRDKFGTFAGPRYRLFNGRTMRPTRLLLLQDSLTNETPGWVWYHEDGTVDEDWTGTFKDGVKVE